MSEALCVKKADLIDLTAEVQNLDTIRELLPTREFFLVERTGDDGCEKDLSYLQLLPYITAINEKGEVFTYMRGKSGGESKLIGNCSIGLGGHVDVLPHTTGEAAFIETITMETVRELVEEIGHKGDDALYLTIRKLLEAREWYPIYDTSNEVGKYHLALAMIIRIKSSDIGKLEEGNIEGSQWLNPYVLSEMDGQELALENWSKIMLKQVMALPDPAYDRYRTEMK